MERDTERDTPVAEGRTKLSEKRGEAEDGDGTEGKQRGAQRTRVGTRKRRKRRASREDVQ